MEGTTEHLAAGSISLVNETAGLLTVPPSVLSDPGVSSLGLLSLFLLQLNADVVPKTAGKLFAFANIRYVSQMMSQVC